MPKKKPNRVTKAKLLNNMKLLPFPCVTMISPRWSTERTALWQVMLTAIWSSATSLLLLEVSATLLLLEVLTTLKAVCPVGGTLFLCFSFFSWFKSLCLGIIVVRNNLQYASCEPSLAFFNRRNVFSQLLLCFRLYHNSSSAFRMTYQWIELVCDA